MPHRDEAYGLFIGTSKRLLALMNSAPAELLHHLIHAALQPHSATPLFFGSPLRASGDGGLHRALNRRCGCRSQKKRRPQCRRRNTDCKKPPGFSEQKPPFPTWSGSAANTEMTDTFVYCPSIGVSPSGLHVDPLRFAFPGTGRLLSPLTMRFASVRTPDTLPLLLIPSSARRRSGIRSHVSRRSCAPSSDRSSRSSRGRDSPPAGTSDRDRSAVRGDSR